MKPELNKLYHINTNLLANVRKAGYGFQESDVGKIVQIIGIEFMERSMSAVPLILVTTHNEELDSLGSCQQMFTSVESYTHSALSKDELVSVLIGYIDLGEDEVCQEEVDTSSEEIDPNVALKEFFNIVSHLDDELFEKAANKLTESGVEQNSDHLMAEVFTILKDSGVGEDAEIFDSILSKAISLTQANSVGEQENQGEGDSVNGKIVSDGGSSSYYDLPIPDWLVLAISDRQAKGNAHIRTEELIDCLFGNDFDFGNVFKSLVRAYQATKGGGKEGNSVEYDCNKITYSANKIKERFS